MTYNIRINKIHNDFITEKNVIYKAFILRDYYSAYILAKLFNEEEICINLIDVLNDYNIKLK